MKDWVWLIGCFTPRPQIICRYSHCIVEGILEDDVL